jgi:hypothetical protein
MGLHDCNYVEPPNVDSVVRDRRANLASDTVRELKSTISRGCEEQIDIDSRHIYIPSAAAKIAGNIAKVLFHS